MGVSVIETEETIRSKIRKYRNTLYILGTGTMIFGIWNAVKIIVALVHTPQLLFRDEIFTDNMDETVVLFTSIFMILFIAITMAIYIFTGDRARSEGRGKKKKPFYIGVVFLLALLHVASTIIYAVGLIFSGKSEPIMSIIVTIVVDITAAVTLAEMGFSAVMIRIYERKILTENK